MNAIKKILSITLVLMLLLGLCTVGFTASADTSTDFVEDVFVDLYPTTSDEYPDDSSDDEYPDEDFYSFFIGDVDSDFKLTVKDATLIQKYVALITEFSYTQEYYADTDGDAKVTVKDATAIQKAVALLTNGVPMQPQYSYTYGTDITSTIKASGSMIINLEVKEPAWYSIVTTCDEANYDIVAVIFDENYLEITYGTDMYLYLETGKYFIIVDSFENYDCNAEVSITVSDEFELFDPENAIEVDSTIDELSSNGPWLYKVPAVSHRDSMLIYTEGDDPMLDMLIFDGNLSRVNISDYHHDDHSNLFAVEPLTDLDSDFYYIYITQSEGGTDFTLYLGALSYMIREYAVDIECDELVTVPTTYTEATQDSFTYAYSAVSSIYRFVPDEYGYYSFNINSEVMGYVNMIVIPEYDNEMSDTLIFEIYDSYGPIVGSAEDLLFSSYSYYIILSGALVSDSDMTLMVKYEGSVSSDDEISSDDEMPPFDDSSYDEFPPSDSEIIFVGDTKEVTLTDFTEEKWFKLTAEEDMQIIVTSSGSLDAYLAVFNADGELIGYCDDMGDPFNSMDFAAIGDIVLGEEYYFCIGSYEAVTDSADSFTVSVVDSKNYEL